MKLKKRWIWRTYRRDVKNTLLCMPEEKSRILRELRAATEQFFQEHPEAGLEGLNKKFGDPHDIALEYLRNNDAISICHKLKVWKMIKTILVILALIAVLICLGVTMYHFFTQISPHIVPAVVSV